MWRPVEDDDWPEWAYIFLLIFALIIGYVLWYDYQYHKERTVVVEDYSVNYVLIDGEEYWYAPVRPPYVWEQFAIVPGADYCVRIEGKTIVSMKEGKCPED